MFRRLYLIASCSTALQQEAARLAVVIAKKGKDISYYNDACNLLNSITSKEEADSFVDPKWLGEQEKHNAADSKKLENELKQYKNNLIRESIRVCHATNSPMSFKC